MYEYIVIFHIHSYGYAVVIRPYASFLSHAEVVASKVSAFLYGTADPKKLTAEQKDTVANIMSLARVGAAVGGSGANAVSGSLNAESAVENNALGSRTYRENLKQRTDDFARKSLALEEKLLRLGIPDLEPYALAYEQCGGCKEADEKDHKINKKLKYI